MSNLNAGYQLDPHTGAIITGTYEGKRAHQGYYFQSGNISFALANGASLFVEAITPSATTQIHVKNVEIYAAQLSIYKVYEGPTLTPGSTAVPAINFNRQSSVTSQMTIRSDPSGVLGGTMLIAGLPVGTSLPGGRGTSGSLATGVDWFLKPSTTYVIEVNNISGVAIEAFILASWYEEV